MKVYTLKANENWHSDRYYSEWVNNCGALHTNNIQEADVLWLLPSWVWRSVPPHLLREKKVIATIHHIVPEKFNLSDFKQRDQFVDHYHVPCEQTKNNILKAVDLGVPQKNLIVGKSSSTGKGIVSNPTPTPSCSPSHWCSLTEVGKIINKKK